MKMKLFKNLIYTMITAMVLFAVNACKDDFSDEDFFNLQKSSAASADSLLQIDTKTLSAFNFIAVTSGNPAVGLDVSLIPLDVVTATPFSGTTDAAGVASFTDVPTGSSLIEVSGANVVTTRVVVTFDDNDVTYNGSRPVVIKRAESTAVEIYSTDFSGSTPTARIEGTVTAELDLTNTTPEIPSNLVISADFSNTVVIKGPNMGSVTNVTVAGAGDFGASPVDSLGKYSLVVPANDNNTGATLLIPSFTDNQNIAFTRKDGVDVGPTMENILTGFGANYTYNFSIPEVPGLLAEFPAPPVSTGAGFALTLTPLATRLGNWETGVSFTQNDADPSDTTMVHYDFNLNSTGGGYLHSPTVTLTGGGAANQSMMYASLEGLFTDITSDGGDGAYVLADVVTIDLYAWAVNVDDDLDTVQIFINSIDVTADATGNIPTDVFGTGNGVGDGFTNTFTTEDDATYGYRIMRYEGTASAGVPSTFGSANVTNVSAEGEVSELAMRSDPDLPSYYTSAPTITFAGGANPVAAVVQASASISNFMTYFMVDVDNTGNTSPYNVLPTFVNIKYEGGWAFNTGFGSSESSDVRTEPEIYFGMNDDIANIWQGFGFAGEDIVNHLVVDGAGDLQWNDPNYGFMTWYMGSPNT